MLTEKIRDVHTWSRGTYGAPRLYEELRYRSVVLDVFSRRVVGWSMANHLRAELVLAALEMALSQRCPDGVIHHSDQGCQYTSMAFGQRCRDAGVRPSMGSVGDCFDKTRVAYCSLAKSAARASTSRRTSSESSRR